ncbi:Ornithine aminotransferase [Metarhizium album ARSEF 1941]|uniref:Ornithine aminotransferase n=1 Tax=Metarhizium album (strain ARSEF 1941) TaxID=1081103 RepID=A0A0B2WVB9_METAS|nr:Ornithine aminotransferase [Metarhizium album ARSEF 1941]KHN97579.1 Ornithine aminotransferase [Metarhizium album ARSEF 1941]
MMPSNGSKDGHASKLAIAHHAATTDIALGAERDFSAHNYQSLPIVFSRAQGASVWDPEGRHYLDFHSASTALNHGHCHPKLVAALVDQASRLTLTSRAFHNDVYPQFAEMVTKTFGYDRVLPSSTGAEAAETAIKVARKWAYKVKGVPEDGAIVLGAAGNHHGRTLATISLASDAQSRENYGPLVANISCHIPGTAKPITYNDRAALREAFESAGFNLAAFVVEPIQGDAGVIVADDDYLREARRLCDEHNVLLICDEIQTGIARTGRLLGHYWSGIRPDLVLLGKTMTGGMYPVSCVLGSDRVILTVEPGTHGSTYGGNPLGAAVAMRALEVIDEENLVERAERLGNALRERLRSLQAQNPVIQTVRGRGLLNAIVIDQSKTNGHSGIELCEQMRKKGLLLKSSRSGVIRIAPPLVVTEEQLERGLDIVKECIEELPNLPSAV